MASALELGIDEVYYTVYAKHNALSHFDHPPFVGWLIEFFTCHFKRSSSFFIRCGPLIFGTFNVFIFYKIIKLIANERTAIFGAALFIGSVYNSVIAGTFILPDTSMLTFWLGSIYCLIFIVAKNERSIHHWILFGLFTGLAMLSKYHSAVIWVGLISFVIWKKRSWVKLPSIYLAALITLLIISPIFIWNYQNEFISFKFHENRIGETSFNPIGMLRELAGAFAYNGPINFILCIYVIISRIQKKIIISKQIDLLIALISLPLILVFLLSSNWSNTLPHWTCPAYTTLLIPVVIFVTKIRAKFIHWAMKSYWMLLLLIPTFILIVQQSTIFIDNNDNPRRVGRNDFTLDMSQWKEIEVLFQREHRKRIAKKEMTLDAPIVISRWFPGAHIDHYIARECGLNVLPIGDLKSLHEYYWLKPKTEFHGKAYFISTSHIYQEIEKIHEFKSFELIKAYPLIKNGKIVQNLFIYIVTL